MIQYITLFIFMCLIFASVYAAYFINPSKKLAAMHGAMIGFLLGFISIPVLDFIFKGSIGDYSSGYYILSAIAGCIGAFVYAILAESTNR